MQQKRKLSLALSLSHIHTHGLSVCSGQCNGRWICCSFMHTADKLSLSDQGEGHCRVICERRGRRDESDWQRAPGMEANLGKKKGEFGENYRSHSSEATEVWMSCSHTQLLCLREIRDIWDVFLAMTLLHGGWWGSALCPGTHKDRLWETDKSSRLPEFIWLT